MMKIPSQKVLISTIVLAGLALPSSCSLIPGFLFSSSSILFRPADSAVVSSWTLRDDNIIMIKLKTSSDKKKMKNALCKIAI